MRDGRGRTLVFARDVGAAQAAHRALYAAGLDVLSYHRDVPPAQRADALEAVARWVKGSGNESGPQLQRNRLRS